MKRFGEKFKRISNFKSQSVRKLIEKHQEALLTSIQPNLQTLKYLKRMKSLENEPSL